MQQVDAVVAGHLCLDIIPELHGQVLFEPGRLIEAGPATIATGGAVSNTGQSLHKLGVNVKLIGKVGEGLFGDAIKHVLEQTGADLSCDLVTCDRSPTSYTIVVNLAGQDRMFLHAPGCNSVFGAEDVSDEVLASARLMHFGYPPLMARMFADEGAELVALFRRAKDLGCTTSLDMSLPDANAPSGRANWPRILESVLPYVDLFLPSIEEVLFMLDRPMFESLKGSRLNHLPVAVIRDLANECQRLGAKIVGIKMGSRGLYLNAVAKLEGMGRATPQRLDEWSGVELWAPCFKIDVAGTTGAGDSTIAGVLVGLLKGLGPAKSAEAGVAAGAFCCERPDAISGLRPWSEIEARIIASWERVNPNLGTEWAFSDNVWVDTGR
jgi:sugar/nucleoside kinase (ribokinase family)